MVDKVISLINVIRDLVSTNPKLIKFVTVGTALVGVFALITGIAFKVVSALSGVTLFFYTFGDAFTKLSGLMKTGALTILGFL